MVLVKIFKKCNLKIKKIISKSFAEGVYLINENSPSVLTVHGTSDRWVPYDQALLLDEKLGDKHRLLTIEDGGHYGFSEDEDNLIRQTIASFLIENYKK